MWKTFLPSLNSCAREKNIIINVISTASTSPKRFRKPSFYSEPEPLGHSEMAHLKNLPAGHQSLYLFGEKCRFHWVFNFFQPFWISFSYLERFSFECRKVIGFAFTTLRDWLKRFAPLFYPIRRKTKTNCVTLACIFPRFASATCNYFEF